MKDNFSFSSRYERSKKGKKQTLILNVLIGIVFIGILAVGASMLLGDDESASENQQNNDNTTSVPDTNNDSQESSDQNTSEEAASDEEGKENEENSESGTNDDTAVKEDEAEENSSESESQDSEGYKTHSDETAGPEGEWEPVGTVQEEHQPSFEKGTTDWEEKEKALQYATGLSPDEIEYWWIGNGGSADTVKGVVSKPEEKDNPYVVMLQWVDGQGWKPTSVERVPGAANQ